MTDSVRLFVVSVRCKVAGPSVAAKPNGPLTTRHALPRSELGRNVAGFTQK
jgi:hypothetical protein